MKLHLNHLVVKLVEHWFRTCYNNAMVSGCILVHYCAGTDVVRVQSAWVGILVQVLVSICKYSWVIYLLYSCPHLRYFHLGKYSYHTYTCQKKYSICKWGVQIYL